MRCIWCKRVAAQQAGPAGGEIITNAQSAFLDGWGPAMWLAAGIAAATALVAYRIIPADADANVSPLSEHTDDRELVAA